MHTRGPSVSCSCRRFRSEAPLGVSRRISRARPHPRPEFSCKPRAYQARCGGRQSRPHCAFRRASRTARLLGRLRRDQLLRLGELATAVTMDLMLKSRQKIKDDPGSEERQGKNLVDAALQNGVQCFVWSTLPSSNKISGGRFVSRIYEGSSTSCIPCHHSVLTILQANFT